MKCVICHVDINKAGMDNMSPVSGYPVCEACAEDMTPHEWAELRKKAEEEEEDDE